MLRCNLQEVLDEKKITQTELSEMTGIAQGSISKLCANKKSRLGFDTILKICEALDINDLDELFSIIED